MIRRFFILLTLFILWNYGLIILHTIGRFFSVIYDIAMLFVRVWNGIYPYIPILVVFLIIVKTVHFLDKKSAKLLAEQRRQEREEKIRQEELLAFEKSKEKERLEEVRRQEELQRQKRQAQIRRQQKNSQSVLEDSINDFL